MGFPTSKRNAISSEPRPVALKLIAASALVLIMVGCRPGEEGAQVAGWSPFDPTQRHPIMVSQQSASLSIRVARRAYGLSPHQRSQVIAFLERYRSVDAGNSKLVIAAPSGASNEVAAMQAVAEVRHLMYDMGFDQTSIAVEAYHADRDPQPPVRISYLRFIAEAPQCGQWPTNLADSRTNLNYPNLGCATQRNFAAMVANPADLVGPRTLTPTPGEKRDVQWGKYIKGESTISKKQEDEKVKVKGAN